ncbi:MAG: hypothetical protein GXP62_21135, partial [Oligoflexia bacterium]|nr:hypothetical protein [Oligoflexia bacterium]
MILIVILGVLLLSCTTGPAVVPQTVNPTAPSPAAGERVRFIALGDAGEGNDPQRRVAAAIKQLCADKTDATGPGCQFVVYLGDNFYPKGITGPDDPQWITKWSSIYGDLGLPFYAVLGNHDYGNPPFDRDRARAEIAGPAPQSSPGSSPTRSTWVMPGPWYAFDAGPARFIVLDTNAVMMGWTALQQRAFATAQIKAAGDRPVVVLTHH